MLAVLLLCLGSAVSAQEIEEDWPAEIDYPPNSQYIPPAQFDAATDSIRRELNIKKPAAQNAARKWWWPFGGKNPDKAPPPSEEEIVNVGPREHPAAREPLFRLPVSLRAPDGTTVAAGFYLVRQVPVNDAECRLQLFQEGRLRFDAPARKSLDAPPSAGPVEPLDPKTPVLTHVLPRLSADYTSLTIIMRQGDQEYRTEPLPTLLTERPALRF